MLLSITLRNKSLIDFDIGSDKHRHCVPFFVPDGKWFQVNEFGRPGANADPDVAVERLGRHRQPVAAAPHARRRQRPALSALHRRQVRALPSFTGFLSNRADWYDSRQPLSNYRPTLTIVDEIITTVEREKILKRCRTRFRGNDETLTVNNGV